MLSREILEYYMRIYPLETSQILMIMESIYIYIWKVYKKYGIILTPGIIVILPSHYNGMVYGWCLP